MQGRQDILKIYARDKRLDGKVDLKTIALADVYKRQQMVWDMSKTILWLSCAA